MSLNSRFMRDSTYYRAMAAKCRELAKLSRSDDARDGLLRTAREYDDEVVRLDGPIGPQTRIME